MYGTKPQAIPNILEESNILSTEERIEHLDEIRNKAKEAHREAMRIMENHIKANFEPFSQGQKVWLEARNI